jgi:hypothetical protein
MQRPWPFYDAHLLFVRKSGLISPVGWQFIVKMAGAAVTEINFQVRHTIFRRICPQIEGSGHGFSNKMKEKL